MGRGLGFGSLFLRNGSSGLLSVVSRDQGLGLVQWRFRYLIAVYGRVGRRSCESKTWKWFQD